MMTKDKIDFPKIDSSSVPLVDTYKRALKELEDPPKGISVPAWKKFHTLIGGLRPREFTIFCAPTGVGKTQFLCNMSAHFLTQGVKHFVMSVETGDTDYVKRVMSVLARKDLNTGDAVDKEMLNEFDAIYGPLFKTDRIYLSRYEDRVHVSDLVKRLTEMHAYGYKIAFIDNLNFFMEVKNQSDTVRELDSVVHTLIMLCKQIDIHIIMVMHPKKTDSGRVDSEFDIKGSSTAVQEAHNVWLFNPPEKEDNRDPYSRELTLKKVRRRGKSTNKNIWFSFNEGQYTEIP